MTRRELTRRIVKRLPTIMAAVGILLVFSSFFFFSYDYQTLGGITAGLFVLLLAIWFAAHPYLKNTRENLVLRAAVDEFLDLVKELRALHAEELTEERVRRAREEMRRSADRIVELAVEEDDAEGEGIGGR